MLNDKKIFLKISGQNRSIPEGIGPSGLWAECPHLLTARTRRGDPCRRSQRCGRGRCKKKQFILAWFPWSPSHPCGVAHSASVSPVHNWVTNSELPCRWSLARMQPIIGVGKRTFFLFSAVPLRADGHHHLHWFYVISDLVVWETAWGPVKSDP